MRIRLRGRGRKVHLGESLPLRRDEGPRIARGVVLVLFGLVFTVFSVVSLAMALGGAEIEGDEAAAYVVLPVFAAVGLGIVAWGIGALRHRLRVEVDEEEVRVTRRGLRGTRHWRQPRGAYAGVLATERHVSGGQNRSSYTEYRVVLKHSTDKKHDVTLYYSRSSEGHRAETEAFARLLSAPVLVETGDGVFGERDAGDLDKSVKQLVAEGKLRAPARVHNLVPGNRLMVDRDGDAMVFEVGYRRGLIVSLIFLAVGVGVLYWYFGPGMPEGQGDRWVVPLVGGTFTLAGLVAFVFCLFGRERLRVSPAVVHHSSSVFQWKLRDRRLEANTVEEVALKKDKHGRFQLTISSDEDVVRFGGGLARDEKEYVRNCVLATIAR